MGKFKQLMLLLITITVIKISDNHIWIYASNDLTQGTDMACEQYWREIMRYQSYQYIHIVNDGWTPSPKLIKNF